MRDMRIVINDYQDNSSTSFTWSEQKETSLILHNINFPRYFVRDHHSLSLDISLKIIANCYGKDYL